MIALNKALNTFAETTVEQRYAIRIELLKMLAGRPTMPSYGLCRGVEEAAENTGDFVPELCFLFRSWDHFK